MKKIISVIITIVLVLSTTVMFSTEASAEHYRATEFMDQVYDSAGNVVNMGSSFVLMP